MAHTIFDNKVVEQVAEEILLTKLNAMSYLKVDNSLVGQDGRKVDIHTYTVQGELEELGEGEGNTGEFSVSYTTKEYEVKTLQGKYSYTDEQADTDSFAIDTLVSKVADEFVNVANKKYFEELEKATLTVPAQASTGLKFEDIVDAIALFKESDKQRYLFVNHKQLAKIRKNLKDTLSYNNDIMTTGYVGTVAGVHIIATNILADDKAYITSADSVTFFGKRGMENEVDRDANIRTTYNYLRKVYTIALTDAREVVKFTFA